MNNFYLQQQPTGFFQNPQNFQKNMNVIYQTVNDINEAQIFQVPLGMVGLLFNNSKKEFYMKNVDSFGMQSLKKYVYQEIPIERNENQDLKNNEVDSLTKRINQLEILLQNVLPTPKEKEKVNESTNSK